MCFKKEKEIVLLDRKYIFYKCFFDKKIDSIDKNKKSNIKQQLTKEITIS